MLFWQTTRYRIDLSEVRVMGIVNVTPDSFSDGGMHADSRAALRHAEQLVAQGADILDIGGESTRPGAASVAADVEWTRISEVLRGALQLGVPVSVDTCKPEVMQRALDLGVDIVNDIRALGAPGAMAAVAAHPSCGVCLMHMQGAPASMQSAPSYVDVMDEVTTFLRERQSQAQAAGIDATRIALDPGIGFGKLPEHNLILLRRQAEFVALGQPLLVGWSRKSTLGWLTARPQAQDRLVPSVAAALAAAQLGAHILRVHDVADTVDALRVWRAAGLPR